MVVIQPENFSELSADITGVNVELIEHFHVILECINGGFPINTDAFEQYAAETRHLYLRDYAWYHMPSSVHQDFVAWENCCFLLYSSD